LLYLLTLGDLFGPCCKILADTRYKVRHPILETAKCILTTDVFSKTLNYCLILLLIFTGNTCLKRRTYRSSFITETSQRFWRFCWGAMRTNFWKSILENNCSSDRNGYEGGGGLKDWSLENKLWWWEENEMRARSCPTAVIL